MLKQIFDGTYYSFFERGVAFVLSLGVIGVIVIAGGHLAISLYEVYARGLAEFDYVQFQGIFEQILTVLIALEFNHSLSQVAIGVQGFIQVRTIVLIAILAAVRKFIVLDIEKTQGDFLLGLGASVFALGAVYVMLVWIDQRTDERKLISGPGETNGH
ncbi:MAG: phosphate-starvation-inducible PsiE family protein [Alphaproteobacteria bacterium]